MSNHLAVATVSAVLRRRLQTVLDAHVPELSARVTTARPNAPAAELPTTGVNLFMFQVSPNAALRNIDLPTRRGNGDLSAQPTVAVDLHYLLTFYGEDAKLEPQILLACAVRALHAVPVLTVEAIQDTLTDPTFSFVAKSDLVGALERVRFAMAGLSLEEMSKLWSVFFQSPYVLSVAYIAGPVLIESDVSVSAPLPVRTRNFLVTPLRRPVVSAVLSQLGGGEVNSLGSPISSGHTLVLRGLELGGIGVAVRIDGVEVPPISVSDTEIKLALPAPLRAGAHGVQVIQKASLGSTPASGYQVLFSSNVASFVLSPSIVATGAANHVDVTFTPNVGKRQRVRLLLSRLDPPPNTPPQAFAFEAPSRDTPTAPDDIASISIPIADVPPGKYLARAQVDGAESPLGVDSVTGMYAEPQVTVP